MNASFMSLILNRIKIISELAFYAFDLQTFVYYIAVTMLKSEDTVMIDLLFLFSNSGTLRPGKTKWLANYHVHQQQRL